MSRAGSEIEDRPRWHGSTAGERSAQRRRRLLDAGFRLLGGEGAAAVSVRAVARNSGLSPRYFYESFPDRDALLLAVWDDQYANVGARVEAAIAEAPPDFPARMRAALDAAAAWLEEDPMRSRAMLLETIAEARLRMHARRRLPELVLQTAMASVGGHALDDVTPKKLSVTVTAASGAIVNLFLEWASDGLDVTRRELVDSVLEVVSAIMATALTTSRP
ncbi:TetR family transcriptional regulator [Amycolatopsis cynarae]|uniref:TetR family transcriptional regulator n=1 Tax=Amycolatopsis cynarae TaxID=2995223 RepID=A0ABY7B8S8_9PSEU|nr:TetR family transcriptional regulator [Amycolatopsis sp. HUAS 11-8]WAL68367.1 TetR family transcriptional regulator [Amycolatopsis sp. HUAS 11-8]